jgi:hypothetical protein
MSVILSGLVIGLLPNYECQLSAKLVSLSFAGEQIGSLVKKRNKD